MRKHIVHRAPSAFKDAKSNVYCAGTLSAAEKKKIGAGRIEELVSKGKLVEVDLNQGAAQREARDKRRAAAAETAAAEQKKSGKTSGRGKSAASAKSGDAAAQS